MSGSGRQIPLIPTLVLLKPHYDQLQRLGMDSLSLGIMADVLLQGRKISEFQTDGVKKIDLILKADQRHINSPEELYYSLVATPSGNLVGSGLCNSKVPSDHVRIRNRALRGLMPGESLIDE